MDQPLLMSREEAASSLGMSLSHFQRHVQAEMPCVRSGQLKLYRRKELEGWVDRETDRKGVRRQLNGISVGEAHDQFIADCSAGIALNKHGRKYTKKAIKDLDSSLNRLPARIRDKFLDEITDPDFQRVIDDFKAEKPPLSSSRINSVIGAVRSLSRWAQKRGKLTTKLAGDVQLPADDSTPRDRIATPGEFAYLLDQLEPEDALPWAIAGYATARSQEIEHLDWPEVDFVNDVLLLAGDDEAKKSEAAKRIVSMVRQLRDRLYAEQLRQGKPKAGRVCPPRRADNKSGCLSLNALQKNRFPIWEDLDLEPIGLQDSRHTAATWLDHAQVSPKVASVFMGHRAPKRQPDAAPITLGRYTHVLPGEIERARDQLQRFLDEREGEEAGQSFKVAVAAR
jgi:integrase